MTSAAPGTQPPAAVGSQALAVGGTGAALMPPPPPRPKRKEAVLEEDDWTASLEAIIERDFFPELPKLESKLAWLQAIRSGDPEQIRQAQLLIAQRRAAAAGGRPKTGATPAGAPLFTPGGTAARVLAGGDTPYIPGLPPGVPLGRAGTGRQGTGARPGTGAAAAGGAEEDDEDEGPAVVVAPPVSLDTFMAAHTSEDNASFQELLEHVNKKRRIKAAQQLAPQPDPKLLITDGRERTDGFGTTGQAPGTLVTWRFEPKNALFYDGANREVLPYSEAELAAQVQGPPKAIVHSATRFPREAVPSASATPSASGTSGAVAGGSSSRGGSAAAGGAAAGRGGGAAGAAAGGKPAAAAGVGGTRGYDILATPSFDPGAGGETPFMTWGDIEGTPMRIEAEDLPPGPLMDGPSFFIKEGTHREQQGQALSSRAAAALRARRGPPSRGGTAPVSASSLAAAAAARRQGTSVAGISMRPGSSAGGGGKGRPPTGPGSKAPPLSEAARRLASSIYSGKARRPDTDLDFGLRASYRGSGTGATPRGQRAGSATPAASGRAASSGGWSAAGTPRGWATPAGGRTPGVHATLEEEELRVQALLKARQAEAAKGQALEAARAAAQQAFHEAALEQGGKVKGRPPVAAEQQQQQAGQQQEQKQEQQVAGGGAADGADLTAGLLDI